MIEEIKQIFDDIKDSIQEMGGGDMECVSPAQYPEYIRSLSGNNAVLFVPVFKSSETKPEKPVGTLNPASPRNYPSGWSEPDGLTGNIWMSYTIVSTSTIYVPWTEPILISGNSQTEEIGITKTFLIYLELGSLDYEPTIPTGGTWIVNENRLEKPISSNIKDITTGSIIGSTSEWSDDNKHINGMFTWMSSGTFRAKDGSLIGTWSEPFCINSARDGKDGIDGTNGKDGKTVEFIYKLCANKNEALDLPAPYSDEDEDDYIPVGWTDQPSSISLEMPIEVVSTRKKGSDGKWGNFSKPVIWASWGEDGTDGDGVEYIFRIASRSEVTQDSNGVYHLISTAYPPICDEGCSSALLPVSRGAGATDAEALAIYQMDEFIPGDMAESIGWDRGWTDDPQDVSPDKPYEFCSKRKYNGNTEEWDWFSEPVLWNKYYGTTSGVFTSFAFTRSTKNLGNMTLTGGTISNPLPDTDATTWPDEPIVWFDSVPSSEDFPSNPRLGYAPIWMTSRLFGSMEEDAQETDWASPILMADNRFFNVEYSASTDINPLDPNHPLPTFSSNNAFIDLTNPEGINENAWRNYCANNGYGIWNDNVDNPKWMATCSFDNGVWSEWIVTQIKGENGDPGRGIVSTNIYYMLSNDGINHPAENSSSWSESVPAFDQYNPYLWTKTVTTYSDNTTSVQYTVSRQGKDGAPGIQGLQGPRGYAGAKYRQSVWKPGTQYYQGAEGETYYDVVIYEPNGKLYLCVLTHNNSIVPGTNTDYWVEATHFDFVATKLLLSERIKANLIETDNIVAKKLHTGYAGQDTNVISIEGNTIDLFGKDVNNNNTSLKLSASDIEDTSISAPITPYTFSANSTIMTSNSTYVSQNNVVDITKSLNVLTVAPNIPNTLILPSLFSPTISVSVSNFSGSGYITIDPEIFWYKNYGGSNPISLGGGGSLSNTINIYDNGLSTAIGSDIQGLTCSVTEKHDSQQYTGTIDLVLVVTAQSYNASANITVSVINGSTTSTASGTYLSQATLFGTNGIIVKFDSNTYMYAYRPPINTNGTITGYYDPVFEMKAGNAAIKVSNGKIGITENGSTYYKPQLSSTIVTW